MRETQKEREMKLYRVYLDQVSYKPEHRTAEKRIGNATAEWFRTVRANSRTEALTKCLPEIHKEFPKLQGIYLSVFVGEKANPSAFASRLSPIQVDIRTGRIREKA